MTERVATYSVQPLTFIEAWDAGQIARFHAERVQRRQTVGEHSWGVAMICISFWPAKTQLVRAAVLHDVPEIVLGDFPHPSKKICVDHQKLEVAEDKLLEGWSPQLGFREQDDLRLKIADMFDFVLYVRREMLMGNSLSRNMFEKGFLLAKERADDLGDSAEAAHVKRQMTLALNSLEANGSRYE